MFHRVMIPLDGSALAEYTLPWAERLAACDDLVLHLVRVVEAPVRATWVPGPVFVAVRAYEDPVARAVDDAASYLSAIQARLTVTAAAVKTAHPVGTAGAGPALVEYERSAAIDLVLLCSHGRGGVARFALGSVATHLLRHGAAPVLLVRPATSAQPSCAIVPLDGSAQAEAALPVAAQLLSCLMPELTLLRIVGGMGEIPTAQRYLDAVKSRLRRERPAQNFVCRTQVAQGDPAQVITAAAGSEALIVMATHGRGGLARWALGSVADSVTRQGAAPVLLVRAVSGRPRPGAPHDD